MLEARFDPGFRGQLQVLCQQLLLPIVFLFQTLNLSPEGPQFVVMTPLLGLQLRFEKPARTQAREEIWGRWWREN